MKFRTYFLIGVLAVLGNAGGNAAAISPSSGVSQNQQITPRLRIPYGQPILNLAPVQRGQSSTNIAEIKHHDNEERGRDWYRSARNTFWSPDFMWPRVMDINRFLSKLVTRLEGYSIPENDYDKLLIEIWQLQGLLSGQVEQNLLTEALRHRIVEVIGKIVDWAPNIDVKSLFER